MLDMVHPTIGRNRELTNSPQSHAGVPQFGQHGRDVYRNNRDGDRDGDGEEGVLVALRAITQDKP